MLHTETATVHWLTCDTPGCHAQTPLSLDKDHLVLDAVAAGWTPKPGERWQCGRCAVIDQMRPFTDAAQALIASGVAEVIDTDMAEPTIMAHDPGRDPFLPRCLATHLPTHECGCGVCYDVVADPGR